MRRCVTRLLIAIMPAACAVLGGCALETKLAVHRVWCDYNTLRTPAMYYERTSREPMDSARVREIRWLYNAGPDKPGTISLTPKPKPLPAGTPVGPVIPGGTVPPSNAAPPAEKTAPLPPRPEALQTPAPVNPKSPVAAQPPDANRTAEARDAWRFIH